jgi:hypothetical protein
MLKCLKIWVKLGQGKRGLMCQKKGKQLFVGFIEGETYVKMKKPRKKKSLASSWEGPFLFMKYLDNKGF